MKKIILFLLFLPGVLVAQEVKWMTFEEAIAAQKKSAEKKLLWTSIPIGAGLAS